MTKFSLLFIVCAINVGYAHADGGLPATKTSPAISVSSKDVSRCTSDPCANTSTGEDQYVIDAREAAAYNKKVLDTGTDQDRWQRFPLYSDTVNPARLTVPIIKSLGLTMQLDPQKGYLTIEKKGAKQIFEVGAAKGSNNSCPKYSLTILEGHPTYAIIQKICQGFQSGPNLYHKSVDYLLYDMETADLVSIWSSAADDKKTPFPKAKPLPTVTATSKGYRFDWTGTDNSTPARGAFSVRANFVREASNDKNKKLMLACYDPKDPKGESTGGPCEAWRTSAIPAQ